MRQESDFLGEVSVPEEALYGIHSVRARENFPDTSVFNINWYKSIGLVKLACYEVAGRYFNEIKKQGPANAGIRIIDIEILEALKSASREVFEGKHYDNFVVPAISGGAGTSINLNINEIIANVALNKIGKKKGDYSVIDPVEHANVFQSTNDVVPTSLKVAVLNMLTLLEDHINALRTSTERLEKEHLNSMRVGYTQMQEAVPGSFGRLFSNYNEALSRDWWRVSKCFERIKVVNLGGSALGTGITVPRYFIMNVVQELKKITGLPVARAENLTDATANLDSFVEIHATLKSHAVNLEKMMNDLRLLSCDLMGEKLVEIPQKQVGSSIMPGKVNPVIPEYVISCSHKVYANDQLISSLAAQGCLDLNAYLPVIGDALLNSLALLTGCNKTIQNNLVNGLKVNKELSEKKLLSSPSITAALVPVIGYNKAAEMARYMKRESCDIITANNSLHLLEVKKLKKLISPENLLSLGFRLQDINE